MQYRFVGVQRLNNNSRKKWMHHFWDFNIILMFACIEEYVGLRSASTPCVSLSLTLSLSLSLSHSLALCASEVQARESILLYESLVRDDNFQNANIIVYVEGSKLLQARAIEIDLGDYFKTYNGTLHARVHALSLMAPPLEHSLTPSRACCRRTRFRGRAAIRLLTAASSPTHVARKALLQGRDGEREGALLGPDRAGGARFDDERDRRCCRHRRVSHIRGDSLPALSCCCLARSCCLCIYISSTRNVLSIPSSSSSEAR